MAGKHFNSFVAPLSVGSGSGLEGTPNIYNATLTTRDGFYVVDAAIGFHYNDGSGVDQVAHGQLISFGPTAVQPVWTASPSTAYNERFKQAGAVGNIGQRDAGIVDGTLFVVQEGNTGHMPPTIWQDWRLWLYLVDVAAGEGLPPTGLGSITELSPVTDKGSYAFGNPSFKIVPCPAGGSGGGGGGGVGGGVGGGGGSGGSGGSGGNCIFVSYFAFGEGAAPGEAGVVAFYNRLAR